jgi:predicted MPP superfamily phosphohydrolase
MAAYAMFIETRRFRVGQAEMAIPCNFGAKLDILHISDLHFKKNDRAKSEFLHGLRDTSVDMVIVTGDIIEEDAGIAGAAEALGGFTPRFGVFAVFGAHDHWDTRLWNVVRDLAFGGYRKGKPNDFERLKRELESAGVICLHNGSHRIAVPRNAGGEHGPSTELWLVGVDDLFAGLDDFDKALDGVPADACRILLTHAVENPEDLVARGFHAVFAGHSHGGQVRVPLLGPIITRSSLQRKFARGIFEVGGTPFHINNGLGTGRWTGIRFLCPPEATFVRLTER